MQARSGDRRRRHLLAPRSTACAAPECAGRPAAHDLRVGFFEDPHAELARGLHRRQRTAHRSAGGCEAAVHLEHAHLARTRDRDCAGTGLAAAPRRAGEHAAGRPRGSARSGWRSTPAAASWRRRKGCSAGWTWASDTERLATVLLDAGWLTAPGHLFHATPRPTQLMRINFATSQGRAFLAGAGGGAALSGRSFAFLHPASPGHQPDGANGLSCVHTSTRNQRDTDRAGQRASSEIALS